LGIEVHKDAGGMYLQQTKYIRDLLKKFNMEKASSCPTPMVIGGNNSLLKENLLLTLHYTDRL